MEIDRLSKACRGFTLLELAISMVIIGLLMAGAVSAYTVYYQKEQISSTKNNIDLVNDAIAAFQQENGYLPCPADPSDPSAQATNCGNTAPVGAIARVDTGIDRATLPVGNQRLWVRIGVVPVTVQDENGQFRQLVPGENAVDGWRNRLAYAVVEQSAVDRNTYTNAGVGAITVNDNAGGPTPIDATARYIVLSHGPDGAGAYSTTGALRAPCNAGSVDSENCDNANAVFRSIGIAGTRSTTGDANNFDDFVLGDTRSNTPTNCPVGQIMTGVNWRTKTVECATTNQLACPAGEAIVGVVKNGADFVAQCRQYTAACPAGEVLIGTNIVNGTMTPKCVKNSIGSCPSGKVQVGFEPIVDANGDGYDDVTGIAPKPLCERIQTACTADEVQVGIDGLTAVCAPRMKSDVCSGNTILIGYNSNGTPNCAQAPQCPYGQVVAGINNGALVCSQPVINGGGCPAGQFVTGVNANGTVNCGSISSNGPVDIGLEFVYNSCAPGTGEDVGGGSFYTCVAYCPAGKQAIGGSCWVDAGRETSSSARWEKYGLSGWECSSAIGVGAQVQTSVRATCAYVQ